MTIQQYTQRDIAELEFPGGSDDGFDSVKFVMCDDHVAALAEVVNQHANTGGEDAQADHATSPRTLTADDPEPAVGSVVLSDRLAWQRHDWNQDDHWYAADSMVGATWADLASHSVTLIHDGGQ